jgi:thiamine biosynthesis protein ThiI
MRVVSLISGGIDSAVSSYALLQRGVEMVFVHFHQQTATSAGAENKVIKIVEHVKQYGSCKRLYLVPFKNIQLELIKKVPARLRMLVYRRMMLRIAERILDQEGATAFVTGDSLGQVASQTVENLAAVYCVTSHPILTPLLGEDKVDVMRFAREIGTYELSILPYEDCCSFLVAPHPETKASRELIETVEEEIDIPKLVAEGVQQARSLDL